MEAGPTSTISDRRLSQWNSNARLKVRDNDGMDDVTIVRSWKAIVGPMFFFVVVALLFAADLTAGPRSVRVLSALLVSMSLVGMFRASRAGHLEVTRNKVTVRTFFRTKVMNQDSIESVEPLEVAQVTRRVFPVITLKDGRSYRVSEFFSQRGSYQKDMEQSIVFKAIKAIEESRTG
jgi:hypothetical protein